MTFPLTLIFMWLVFWRPQEWLLPWMFGWPVLQVIIYIALLGLVAELSQGISKFPKTPAVMLAIGLWFASLMSHIGHLYFQGLLDTYQETFKISLLLVLLLVVTDRISRARAIVMVFVLAAVVMSVHALMQSHLGYGFAGQRPLIWWHPVKMDWVQQSQFFGIFEDPNDLGQLLATALPLAFALPRRLHPIAFLMAAGVVWLIGEALLTTKSRGSMVAVISVVACIIFMRFPPRWMPYLAAVGLIAGLVMCAVGGSTLLDASARERVVFWGQANRAFKATPLFGVGYGMFSEVTEGDRAGHNAYVVCYTEMGILGYWFWFNLLTLGLVGCWRTRVAFMRPRNQSQAYLKRLAGLSMAAMAGFASSAYFLSRAYVFPFFFLFGLLNAVPIIAQRYLPEDHPPLLNLRKDVLLTGTVSTLVSIAYVYASIIILNRG